MYGLFLLFRQFIKTVFSFLQSIPVVGPLLRNSPMCHNVVDYLAGTSKSGSSKKFDV
jgi:hypothetical protein